VKPIHPFTLQVHLIILLFHRN
jgi:hypothetical protein